LILANKADKTGSKISSDVRQKLQDLPPSIHIVDTLPVSALDAKARDTILSSVSNIMGSTQFSDDSIISSARQFELSNAALAMIEQSIGELENQMGSEFIAQTLKNSLMSLQKILGEVFDDQIMDRVFKEFCLGK
jgi:tRNA modification GTPase